MKWRGVDNMLASFCIQHVQKEIDPGLLDATDIIRTAADKKQAKSMFSAWRVYFIDRMMEGMTDRVGVIMAVVV
jgi:hypothetical protein